MELCLATHYKTLEGNIYTQVDGAPIGKTIPLPLAGISLNWYKFSIKRIDSNKFSGKMNEMIFLSFRIKEILKWTLVPQWIEARIQFTIERGG